MENVKYKPGLSVIIPLFNVESYIEECLLSVLAENKNDQFIEVILVDDKSTDNTISKIEGIVESQSNIILHKHKINQGLGTARNTGAKLATKEFITFLDSDDHIQSGTFVQNYNIINNSNYDFLIYPLARYSEVGKVYPGNPGNKLISNNYSIKRKNLNSFPLILYNISTCNKIYRTSFFSRLEDFPTGKYEDIYLSFEAFAKMKECFISTHGAYFYRTRDKGKINKSIMQQKINLNACIDHLKRNVKVFSLYNSNHADLLPAFHFFNIRSTHTFIKEIVKNDLKLPYELNKQFKKSITTTLPPRKDLYLNKNLIKTANFYKLNKHEALKITFKIQRLKHHIKVFLKQIVNIPKLFYRRITQIQYIFASIVFYRKFINCLTFTERPNEAQDNAFHLFKFTLKEFPNLKSYYVISKSKLGRNLKKKYKKNIIFHNSIQHKAIQMLAKYHFFTHFGKYATQLNMKTLKKLSKILFNLDKQFIFLQHGIIINDVSHGPNYNRTTIDFFITSTEKEKDFIKKRFGYNDKAIILTGLPRFDRLKPQYKVNIEKEIQIFVFLTWRSRLKPEEELKIIESVNNLYLELNKLPQNKYKIISCNHYENKSYNFDIREFGNIEFADSKYIPELIKNSDAIITDYSSIQFDFAYQQKRIIYYMPELNIRHFSLTHYRKGYFNYKFDNLGPIFNDSISLRKYIQYQDGKNIRQDSIYAEKVNNFFNYNFPEECSRNIIRTVIRQ